VVCLAAMLLLSQSAGRDCGWPALPTPVSTGSGSKGSSQPVSRCPWRSREV